jgi:osmotically-inducible protein OsmY
MTTASITGTDVRLRDTVIRQLDWDPEVDASAIGVGAAEGVVTLTGFIDSYTGKLAAERAVKHLRGVRAVANDLVVRPMAGRTDPDIAHDAAHVLKLTPALSDTVQATVHNGRVTLTGTVEWLLQKSQGVFNHLSVRPKPVGRDVHRRIVKALHCNADLDAQHISVSMANEVVTLTGTVGSWMQRDAAERAAAAAPGISRVDNQIVVVPPELAEFEPADEIC